jgi:hypothetical protein
MCNVEAIEFINREKLKTLISGKLDICYQENLYKKLNISRRTFYRKLKNQSFSLKELYLISKVISVPLVSFVNLNTIFKFPTQKNNNFNNDKGELK